MRQYIVVEKGNSSPISFAPDFTQEDLHGLKRDIRNKVPDSHQLDRSVVLALQAIRNWTRVVYPTKPNGVEITVTSTVREPSFNELLKGSKGKKAPHVLKIAIDWLFTGSDALDATKRFNTDIRDKGPLYEQLRQIGVSGLGLYGPNSSFGKNFCHMDTRSDDTPFLPRSTPDSTFGNYSFWQNGGPLYADSVTQVELQNETNNQPELNECVIQSTSPWGLSTGVERYIKQSIEDPTTLYKQDITDQDVLDFEHRGVSNRRRLFNALQVSDKVKYSGNQDGSYDSSKDYPIEVGSTIFIPCEWTTSTQTKGDSNSANGEQSRFVDNVKIQATLTSGETNMSIPYPPLFAAITQDPSYRKSSGNKAADFNDIYPQLTVFIWSRVRYLEGYDPLIDVTKDILSINTSSDMNSGASFSLDLSPIMAKKDALGWQSRGTIEKGDFKVTQSFITQLNDDDIQQYPPLLYEMILQANDAIFIRYEKLDIEPEEERFSQLSDRWFDLMGLIDASSSNRASGATVSLNVKGRCFQKALNDESGYFNPYSVGKTASFFGKAADLVSPRSFDGGIFQYRTIEKLTILDCLEFVLLALVSNEYVPSICFEQNWTYDDRNHITLSYEEKGSKDSQEGGWTFISEADKEIQRGEFGLRGIWQKIKLWIDPRVSQYVVYDDSISTPEGSIWDHFTKICQSPYVEVFTETIGDWFYIIVRQPPFTKEHYRRLMTASSASRSGLGDYSYEIDNDAYKVASYSEWKKKYREAYIDVVDEDEDIVRRGIYERSGDGGFTFYNESPDPNFITLQAKDITSCSLDFSREVYTWYEVDTRGMYSNTGGPYGMPIPAVYFEELAQIYGSNRLSVSSNYIDLHSIRGGSSPSEKRDLLEQEIAQLLGYLIETHIYLPFTREGSITIDGGDRRIKKGTFIYNEATDEIFYVTAVSHQLQHTPTAIHRITTVNVSRGMIKGYIQGIRKSLLDEDGETKEYNVSYFNIVDMPRIREQALEAVNELGNLSAYDHKKPAIVNSPVLNFFLQRKQFD